MQAGDGKRVPDDLPTDIDEVIAEGGLVLQIWCSLQQQRPRLHDLHGIVHFFTAPASVIIRSFIAPVAVIIGPCMAGLTGLLMKTNGMTLANLEYVLIHGTLWALPKKRPETAQAGGAKLCARHGISSSCVTVGHDFCTGSKEHSACFPCTPML